MNSTDCTGCGSSPNINVADRINNRYTIIEILGQGGMGTVFLTEDILINRQQVALKCVDEHVLTKELLNSFKKEFEVMTRLKHPNLVQVFDFGFDTSLHQHYITMEYIDGFSLRNLLTTHGAQPPQQAISILVDLCRAISFIHSRQVVHRDINPGNIMLDTQNTVKLMDFGLADLQKSDHRQKGTLSYLAPEILKGQSGVRSDIFALGITVFELVTNRNFYHGYSSQYIVHLLQDISQFNQHRKIMLQLVPDTALRSIIDTMTAHESENRYQHCSEIIEAVNKTCSTDYPIETERTKEAYILGAGFVGRTDELQLLKDTLKKDSKTYKAVWVQGDAGVGKSRLFYEFKNWCRINDIVFMEGSCFENIHRAFNPFLPILSELLLKADNSIIQKYGPDLKKILPGHCSLNEIKPSEIHDPKTQHNTIVMACAGCIADCARTYTNGYVLYLNDMHWSDEGSIEIVERLLRKNQIHSNDQQSSTAAVHLFLSSRIQQINPLESIVSENTIEIVQLQPFNEKNIQQYIEEAFGRPYIGTHFHHTITDIYHKVGGNPFFLQELIKSMIADNIIIRTCQCWELNRLFKQVEIPKNLEDLIRARIDRLHLTRQEQIVLQTIALLDRAISWDELHRIVEVDINFLIYLEQVEILRSEYLVDHFSYRTAHDLIRTIVISHIENKEALHQLIAHSLETIHCNELHRFADELAYHYVQAKNQEKSILYLEMAGEKAKNDYENITALNHFNTLLDLIPDNDIEKKLNILIIHKFELLYGIHQLKRCCAICKDVAVRALQAQYPFYAAKAYRWLGICYNDMGHGFDEVIACYQQALHQYKKCDTDNTSDIVSIYSRLSYLYLSEKKDYKQASIYLEEALAHIKDKTSPLMQAVTAGVYSNFAQIAEARGLIKQAIEHIKRSMDIIEPIKNKTIVYKRDYILFIGFNGFYHFRAREYAKAEECYDRQIAMARELDNKALLAGGLVKKAELMFAMKMFGNAKKLCDEAQKYFSEITEYDTIFIGKVICAKVEYVLGNKDDGIKQLQDLLDCSKNKFETAKLCYELWCMCGKESYRKTSLHLYNEITKTTPDERYLLRLKCLKENTAVDYFNHDPKSISKNKHTHYKRDYRTIN